MADAKPSSFTPVTTMAGTDVFPVITGIGTTPAQKVISKSALKTDLALVKADVGLGSVDNTADTAKPVSTAQQAALDLKAPLASPTFTGTVAGITASMVGAPSGSGTSSGTNTGDQSVPTNAAGTDLDTATDITKFATAKAIKDAHNVPSVVPGTSGNVLTSDGTDWTSAAAAGGGGGQTLVTKVVAASGGDYTTLQAALAAASAGWTIWIAPGTYSLAANTTSSLDDITIIGAGSNCIIDLAGHRLELDGTRNIIQNVRINWTSGGSSQLLVNGTHVRIQNCYLDTTGSTNVGGTIQFGSYYAKFLDNHVITVGSISDQILFTGGRHTIVGNYFELNSTWSGALISIGNGRSTVTGNNFFGNNGSGALGTNYLIYSSSSNDVITGNVLSWGGTGGVGIKVAGAETTVSGNNTTGFANGGIILTAASTHCAAVGNVCYSQAVTDSGTANTVASNVT